MWIFHSVWIPFEWNIHFSFLLPERIKTTISDSVSGSRKGFCVCVCARVDPFKSGWLHSIISGQWNANARWIQVSKQAPWPTECVCDIELGYLVKFYSLLSLRGTRIHINKPTTTTTTETRNTLAELERVNEWMKEIVCLESRPNGDTHTLDTILQHGQVWSEGKWKEWSWWMCAAMNNTIDEEEEEEEYKRGSVFVKCP